MVVKAQLPNKEIQLMLNISVSIIFILMHDSSFCSYWFPESICPMFTMKCKVFLPETPNMVSENKPLNISLTVQDRANSAEILHHPAMIMDIM